MERKNSYLAHFRREHFLKKKINCTIFCLFKSYFSTISFKFFCLKLKCVFFPFFFFFTCEPFQLLLKICTLNKNEHQIILLVFLQRSSTWQQKLRGTNNSIAITQKWKEVRKCKNKRQRMKELALNVRGRSRKKEHRTTPLFFFSCLVLTFSPS